MALKCLSRSVGPLVDSPSYITLATHCQILLKFPSRQRRPSIQEAAPKRKEKNEREKLASHERRQQTEEICEHKRNREKKKGKTPFMSTNTLKFPKVMKINNVFSEELSIERLPNWPSRRESLELDTCCSPVTPQ